MACCPFCIGLIGDVAASVLRHAIDASWVQAEGQDLRGSYNATREAGLGAEVKRRILMGTYALSAGYYDAYYQKAQKVCQRLSFYQSTHFAVADVALAVPAH